MGGHSCDPTFLTQCKGAGGPMRQIQSGWDRKSPTSGDSVVGTAGVDGRNVDPGRSPCGRRLVLSQGQDLFPRMRKSCC